MQTHLHEDAATLQHDVHPSHERDLDSPAVTPAAHPLLDLQRSAGNAAVAAELQREADQRSPVLDVVGRGGGRSLPSALQRDMESRLGADFSGVRVHDDSAARASAAAVGARAYTTGHEVVLGDGVDLGSHDGQVTLAHELTHVVQQRSGPVSGTPTGDGVAVSDPGDRFEQEAEATAHRVMSGEPVALESGPAAGADGGAAVQREELPEEMPDEEELQMQRVQREELPEEELVEGP